MASVDNVYDIAPINKYVASSGQTVFDYDFPIFDAVDLRVYVGDVLQSIGTDYTVQGEGNENGGTVTFTSGRSSGQQITIYRLMPIERLTDMAQNGPMRAADFNQELDRITMYLQEVRRDMDRSLRFGILGNSPSPELSPIDNWKDRYLYVNSSGALEPSVNVGTTPLSQSVIGDLLYPTTQDETDAGVSPVNRAYPPGNVLRYGADTAASAAQNDAAFKAAIDSSHDVFVPYSGNGLYKISQPIVLTKLGQRLQGEAVGGGLGTPSIGVVIDIDSTFPSSGTDAEQAAIVLTNRYQKVGNLTVSCHNYAAHGMYGEGGLVTHGHFHDINVIESSGDAFLFRSSTWMNRFDMCRATTCQGWGFNFDALTGSDGHTTLSFRNCYVSGSVSTGGFRFDAVAGFTMDACAVDSTPGWVVQMVAGSQGVINGINCESSVRLFDLADASSLRQRLVVNGGRFFHYGSNASPPASIIDNGGFLQLIGVEFSSTNSFTVFLEARGNSVTDWRGNSIKLLDQTNSISNSCYVDADNILQLSNNAASEERLDIRGASSPRIQLSETGHTANQRNWQISADAGVFRMSTLNDAGAVLANFLSFDRVGNRWVIAGIQNYADDAAAASGGVPVNGLYRTASALKIRVS